MIVGIATAQQKHPILSALPGGGILSALIEAKNAKPGENHFLDRLKSFVEDAQKSVSDLFKGGGDRLKPKPKPNPSTDEDGLAKARKAQLDLAEANADALARVAAAELKDQEAAEKERYAQGLESLAEYYANRIAMTERQGKAEADALYSKIVALQAAPLEKGELQAERDAKVAKLAADFQVKLLENAAAVKSLKAEEAKESEALQQKALDFEKQIQQAQGQRFAAARAETEALANQLDKTLIGLGVGAGERASRVDTFRNDRNAQIDFQQQFAQAKGALDSLDAQRTRIEQQVQSGQLFEFQGEQQIINLEKERLPLLRQIGQALTDAAFKSGDPEKIAQAREFNAQLDQMAISANKAAREMAQFKQDAAGAATNDLSNWMSSGIDQAESLGDAFRGLASSVVSSLRQIAAQMLATYLIQKLLGFATGFLGGGAPASSPVGAGGFGSVQGGGIGMATGGPVFGPGTETSDSIPVRLSRGEYVLRAAAVRMVGVDNLNEINFGTRSVRRRGGHRFAEGGLVDAPARAGGNAALSATLDLDDGVVLKRFEKSPEFHRVIVRTVKANQKAIGQALRG